MEKDTAGKWHTQAEEKEEATVGWLGQVWLGLVLKLVGSATPSPCSVSADTVRCNIQTSAGEASPQKQLGFVLTSVEQCPMVPFTEKLL